MKQALAKLWQSVKAFAKRHKVPILAILISLTVVAALALLIWLDYVSGWTGLGAYENPNYTEKPRFLWGKSVWDWLDLLLVPVVLAAAGLLFNRAERKAEHEIATERTQEARLQSYLDKMTELMLEKKLRTSKPGAEVRDIARARTLTALRSLDGVRKGLLLRFLYESDLTGPRMVVRLTDADLTKANLRQAILIDADLSGANLHETDLSWALLSGANLHGADLSGAYLSGAYLNGANLYGASLSGASLSGASLSGANLHGANLSEAVLSEVALLGASLTDLSEADLSGADLSEANLTGAKATEEQLAQARSLQGATMPDGTVHE